MPDATDSPAPGDPAHPSDPGELVDGSGSGLDVPAELVPDSDPMAALLGGGGLDMGSLLESAMGMAQQLAEAQQQAADAVVVGQSGGGAVRIEVTGGLDFRSVTIDREVVDPDDVDLLQDLVLAALHDVSARVQGLQSGAMGGFPGLGGAGGPGGALGGGLGGLDLGALFGGDPDDEDDDEDEDEDEDDEVDEEDDARP